METDDLELPNESSEEEENGDNAENEEESEVEDEDEDEEDLENDNENNDDEDDEVADERVSTSKVAEEHVTLQPGASNCSSYSIVPYVAALHATSVNTLATTPCSRWLFTGGSDGYIRRFDFFASVAGKSPLTVAQKHPFVDTVTRGGMLLSCWQNEDRPLGVASSSGLESPNESKMSPVYALAVHSQAVWLLSGLDNGTINLQSVRFEQGRILATLNRHKSAVSVLKLDFDETSALSGGWDREVFEWDLNNGIVKRSFHGHSSQLAVIAARPASHLPIPISPVDSDLESLFGDDTDGHKDGEYKPQEFGQNGQSTDTFMTACIDGTIRLWDKRQADVAAKVPITKGVPPWSMSACWSENGEEIFIGRRNSCVEQFSIRNLSTPARTLKLPAGSLAVSSVLCLPNNRHILAASYDTIRLYDVEASNKSVPFYIIPGHRTGVISTMFVDSTCRFLITAGGNRGWEGTTTDVVLISEIGVIP